MATVKPVQKDVGAAARDLTNYQWYAVARTSNGIDLATSTAQVAGVVEMPGSAKGHSTTYHTLGRTKVKVDSAVRAGDFAKIGGTPGVASKASAGDAFFGVFAEDGSAGAIVPVEMDRGTVSGSPTPA